MVRTSWLLFILLAAGMGCAAAPVAKSSTGAPDEYAVYSAFLDHCCVDVAKASGGLYRLAALTDTTTRILWTNFSTGAERDLVAEAFERMELPQELVADFRRRNHEPRCLQRHAFQTHAPVVLMGEDPCPGTEGAVSPPPDEPLVITVSQVGFTSNGQHALLLERFDCGPRCGSMNLVHMERREDKWVVQRSEQLMQF